MSEISVIQKTLEGLSEQDRAILQNLTHVIRLRKNSPSKRNLFPKVKALKQVASDTNQNITAIENVLKQFTELNLVQQVKPDEKSVEHLEIPNTVLEAIISTTTRPVFDIVKDNIDLTSVPENSYQPSPALDTFSKINKDLLNESTKSVGRIDFVDNPYYEYGGTGWVVYDETLEDWKNNRLMVTNRHVAKIMLNDELTDFREFNEKKMKAYLNFGHQVILNNGMRFEDTSGERIKIERVVYVSKTSDIAFFLLETPHSSSLKLERLPVVELDFVSLVGYSAFDSRERDFDVMNKIFRNLFQVKRASPGKIIGVDISSENQFSHDCTSLGGASGSPMLNIKTGQVVGIHYGGISRQENKCFNVTEILNQINNAYRTTLPPITAFSPEYIDGLVTEAPPPILQDSDNDKQWSRLFEDYDMVVAITQEEINNQLELLTDLGIIHDTLNIWRERDTSSNYVYHIIQDDNFPENREYMQITTFQPAISIQQTGTKVVFKLKCIEGIAKFWQIDDSNYPPTAVLVEDKIEDWAYGITINLDLAKIEKDKIENNLPVPDNVRKMLHEFTSDGFSVNNLFVNFNSVNLSQYDATETNSPNDVTTDKVVQFMVGYLSKLVVNDNPYILGYTLENPPTDQDKNVDDELRPVGSAFTMYYEKEAVDRSTLNFLVVTAGGKGKNGITGSPFNLSQNTINIKETKTARMIYSRERLLFPYIVKKVYDGIKEQVWNGLSADGNEFEAINSGHNWGEDGWKSTNAPNGYKFTISDQNLPVNDSGSETYSNTFTCSFVNLEDQFEINFNGSISCSKHVTKNEGCTAKMNASASFDWSAKVKVWLEKNGNGEPIVKIEIQDVTSSNVKHDTDINDCAKAINWILKIFQVISLVFNPANALLYFITGTSPLDDFNKVPNIGTIIPDFTSKFSSVTQAVILPAGQTFFFKNASAFTTFGDIAFDLTYKAPTG